MNDIKFGIITPTIFRTTLKRACKSIDLQGYENYEHIIISDKPRDKQYENLYKLFMGEKRKLYFVDEPYNDFGHTPRRLGADFLSDDVDYVMYLDDDDMYINNTMPVLNAKLQTYKKEDLPNLMVFPCLKNKRKFIMNPPGKYRTTSVQYIHKKNVNGNKISFMSGPYGTDGDFLDDFVSKYGYSIFDSRMPLVQVDLVSRGRFF